jgi:hypothetical protein
LRLGCYRERNQILSSCEDCDMVRLSHDCSESLKIVSHGVQKRSDRFPRMRELISKIWLGS